MNDTTLTVVVLALLALSAPTACGDAGNARRMGSAGADDAAAVPPAEPARREATGRERPRIAITIDDLPWVGPVGAEGLVAATERLLAPLVDRGVRASGFVVCGQLSVEKDGVAALRVWERSGMTLGNHSARHRDLNSAPLELWLDDVRSCDAELRREGFEPRYFRYPMLHQGPTPERRDAALALLAELDYEIAHVTVDNSEYLLRRPFDAARAASDEAEMQRLRELLVRHIVDTARHARQVARRKRGREVDHVLLLHANALVAAGLDAILAALEREGFELISLEEALRDPVYDLPDRYLGRKGVSWLYRIEPLSDADMEWDDARARQLREEVGGSVIGDR